jgi:hypothetical protein
VASRVAASAWKVSTEPSRAITCHTTAPISVHQFPYMILFLCTNTSEAQFSVPFLIATLSPDSSLTVCCSPSTHSRPAALCDQSNPSVGEDREAIEASYLLLCRLKLTVSSSISTSISTLLARYLVPDRPLGPAQIGHLPGLSSLLYA